MENNTNTKSFDSKFSSAHFSTRAIHAGQKSSQWNSRAIIPPIVVSTTFEHLTPGNNAVSHHFE
jgi:O-acetylhomoserine/O-acetylserine sulfhydrylase-like pyridoxal-dependent enzyme